MPTQPKWRDSATFAWPKKLRTGKPRISRKSRSVPPLDHDGQLAHIAMSGKADPKFQLWLKRLKSRHEEARADLHLLRCRRCRSALATGTVPVLAFDRKD